MKFSSLNKTINLFIIGASILANYCILEYTLGLNWLNIPHTQISDGIKPTLLLLAILVFVFLGLIIEAMSLFLREILRTLFNKKQTIKSSLIKLTPIGRMASHYDYWKEKYIILLKENGNMFYNNIESKHIRGLGAQSLLDEAPLHLIEWVVKHHATYLLAFNYIILVSLNVIFILCSSISLLYKIPIILGLLVIIYLLVILAIDKFTYSYTLVYRFAAKKIGIESNNLINNQNDTGSTVKDSLGKKDELNFDIE
ncbi:hypothetical protein [Aureispira sp. CCB-E]|uniref:hypothetical protein n=1 Tax=Aureispira sp. CCB-E TaxID=3051121 RepID=UPI002868BA65|nr:hypothetical protein [Aureispira sp. CCB-E]WMX12406.1 hypothetical protein QP953_16375 [Aureispira sp. CCB-E]